LAIFTFQLLPDYFNSMKYALLGYTYQHYLASLLLAIMDVERKIDWLQLEADVDHKFDDILIKKGGREYTMQLKDINDATLTDLAFKPGHVDIKGTPHKLSQGTNVIFFKEIKLEANTSVLGFPAMKVAGVYLVSLSRDEIEKKISALYKNDPHRRQLMQHFLAVRLDERKLELDRSRLPALTVFDTRLAERTIMVARQILEFQDILYIEGKPGVGKSHLVSLLEKRFPLSLLYRFWTSNQDKDYEERLKFSSFKNDLSKKLFFDQAERSEEQLLAKLASGNEILIVDGFDHVENYRKADLSSFIDFFDRAKKSCKIIILGRPLKSKLSWEKQILGDWNFSQTRRVLKELFLIDEYRIQDRIYQLTSGYPILVRYIAEQYKKDKVVPEFTALESVNSYYEQLFAGQDGKSVLSVFLCCRGYLMDNEMEMFLGELAGKMVSEFIADRPYLFERKLNRISLYHDSLNTFLKQNISDITKLRSQVHAIVMGSLMGGGKRFQSRISHFDLANEDLLKLIKYYGAIKNFEVQMRNVIDFEAIQEFYGHLRENLCQMQPGNFDIVEYYELSLIFNMVIRDHFSTLNGFYYTYVKLLQNHGYTEDDITSSGYLFGMLLYFKNQDATHIYNLKSDRNYDTSRFYQELEGELEKEADFFVIQSRPFQKKSIDRALTATSDTNFIDNLRLILVNVYLHPAHRKHYPLLYSAMENFYNGKDQDGARDLLVALSEKSWNLGRCRWVLSGAKSLLLELGTDPTNNDYLTLSLKDYLVKHGHKGSYELWPEVLGYLRLSLEKGRKIDIESISAFFTKYYQRKDYTLYSADQALTVFEEEGVLGWKDSIVLIQYLQEVSEKGYRWLLGSYIELHEPSFILEVLSKFPINTLNVSWFMLGRNHLQVIPAYVYEHELSQQLRDHSHSRDIPVSEIKNLFHTKWFSRLKRDLWITGFAITLDADDKNIQFLTEHKINFKINPVDDRYRDRNTPQERFEQGILDKKNSFLIKDLSLTPGEVAIMGDGNHTALAEPFLFGYFDDELLKKEMKTILFNALTSRSGYSNSLNVPWVLPGNILRLLSDASVPVEFKVLYDSFRRYLSLSMLKLGSDVPIQS
jgi:hypothetical protein